MKKVGKEKMTSKNKRKLDLRWLQSPKFIIGFVLLAALVVVLGYNSMAAKKYHTTPLPSSCFSHTLKWTDSRHYSIEKCVAEVKKALNYTCVQRDLTVNNSYTYETMREVMGFQKAVKIPNDGIVGRNTWNNLNHYWVYHGKHQLSCSF